MLPPMTRPRVTEDQGTSDAASLPPTRLNIQLHVWTQHVVAGL